MQRSPLLCCGEARGLIFLFDCRTIKSAIDFPSMVPRRTFECVPCVITILGKNSVWSQKCRYSQNVVAWKHRQKYGTKCKT